MNPFFFGPSETTIFGCYHPASGSERRNTGVVLCHSVGDESIRFHRALNVLACRLAVAGIPTLRFDLFGHGDSSGRPEEGRLERWMHDLAAASEELKTRAGVQRLSLAGLRLGGSMAAELAAARTDVDSLVLWDPVVQGAKFLDELRSMHREMLLTAHVVQKPSNADGQRGQVEQGEELLGFLYAKPLLEQLGKLDLLSLETRPAGKVMLVESHPLAAQESLGVHLEKLGSEVSFERSPLAEFWQWSEDLGALLVPRGIIDSIVAWVESADR